MTTPNIQPYYIMDEVTAAEIKKFTSAEDSRIEPRLIEAGQYKGKWAVPTGVSTDPDHQANWDFFIGRTKYALDIDAAWPTVDEDV